MCDVESITVLKHLFSDGSLSLLTFHHLNVTQLPTTSKPVLHDSSIISQKLGSLHMTEIYFSRDAYRCYVVKGAQVAAGSWTRARDDCNCCQSHLTSTILPASLLLLTLTNIKIATSLSTMLTTAFKPPVS